MLLIGKPSISMGHLYHGYVSHNRRVLIGLILHEVPQHPNTPVEETPHRAFAQASSPLQADHWRSRGLREPGSQDPNGGVLVDGDVGAMWCPSSESLSWGSHNSNNLG